MLAEQTDYVLPPAEKFKEEFESLGGSVVVFAEVQKGEQDIRPIVNRMRAQNAEVIYIGKT